MGAGQRIRAQKRQNLNFFFLSESYFTENSPLPHADAGGVRTVQECRDTFNRRDRRCQDHHRGGGEEEFLNAQSAITRFRAPLARHTYPCERHGRRHWPGGGCGCGPYRPNGHGGHDRRGPRPCGQQGSWNGHGCRGGQETYDGGSRGRRESGNVHDGEEIQHGSCGQEARVHHRISS